MQNKHEQSQGYHEKIIERMKKQDELERMLSVWADAPEQELPQGHQERMSRRLGHRTTANSQKIHWFWAASIGLFFGLSAGWLAQNKGEQNEQLASIATWHETIQDQENQFIEQMKAPVASGQSTPVVQSLSYTAMKQLSKFDHEYQNMMRDLENGGDPVLIFKALIEHFEKRIIFLETLKSNTTITQSKNYEKPAV